MELMISAAKDRLRIGFTQTEWGLLPKDWLLRPLASVSSFITKGSTPTTYGFQWEADGVLFLRSECVAEHGLDLTQSMFISTKAHALLARSEVRKGDLLLTITGNVGRAVLLGDSFERANINQHIARVRITDPQVEAQFVYHWLSQPKIRRYFNTITTGQAYPQISLTQVRDALIPVPPLPEQRAIATALSDVDGLLAGLDALIAKKQALKQGAMQQLLTGKQRLPGFKGEWVVRRLNQIISVPITDGPHLTPQFLRDGIPFLSVNNLVDGKVDFNDLRHVSLEDHLEFSRKCKPQKGDILFGKAASVGRVAIVDFDMEFNVWSPIAVIRIDQFNDPRFIYYALMGDALLQQISLLTNSSSQGNIGMGEMKLLEFRLPSKAEQTAIAEVLSDMDAELAALEARRAKTALLKQGMMQELLTGRTRLVKYIQE